MSFQQSYTRICEALNVHSDVALAEALGIRQSFVTDARRRDTIPAEWLIKVLGLRGINPEWLLEGKGKKYLVFSDKPSTKKSNTNEINDSK